jgi:hypothetical protein
MPWGQFIITSYLDGHHMLIIWQPDKMLRDLRNRKGRRELSATSKEILVTGVYQKRFWTLCFHTAHQSTWPRYEKQQCQFKWIKSFSYMEIRIYFQLLCNFWQTYLLIRILPTPTPQKNNHSKTLPFPTIESMAVAIHINQPKTNDISWYWWNKSNNRHADIKIT